LMETVLKTRLERFLEQEALRCQAEVAKVLYVERKFEDVLELGNKRVHLTYRVDRVDEMTDGTIMVLDYKTGSINPMPKDALALEGVEFTREMIRDHIKSFQMPLYLHYLRRQFPERKINSALYHLRTMEIEKFLKNTQTENLQKILGIYLKALDFIMDEIYNLEIPFVDDPVDVR
jgi:RecB family exonuclease